MNELWRHKKTGRLIIVPSDQELRDLFSLVPKLDTMVDEKVQAMSFKFPSHLFWTKLDNYEKVPEAEAKTLWGDKRFDYRS